MISVERIRDSIQEFGDDFLRKILSINEIEDCKNKSNFLNSISARIAAKEAFFKALGTGITEQQSWDSIEIISDSSGKPVIRLLKSGFNFLEDQVHLSISHELGVAVAVVLLTK